MDSGPCSCCYDRLAELKPAAVELLAQSTLPVGHGSPPSPHKVGDCATTPCTCVRRLIRVSEMMGCASATAASRSAGACPGVERRPGPLSAARTAPKALPTTPSAEDYLARVASFGSAASQGSLGSASGMALAGR